MQYSFDGAKNFILFVFAVLVNSDFMNSFAATPPEMTSAFKFMPLEVQYFSARRILYFKISATVY